MGRRCGMTFIIGSTRNTHLNIDRPFWSIANICAALKITENILPQFTVKKLLTVKPYSMFIYRFQYFTINYHIKYSIEDFGYLEKKSSGVYAVLHSIFREVILYFQVWYVFLKSIVFVQISLYGLRYLL